MFVATLPARMGDHKSQPVLAFAFLSALPPVSLLLSAKGAPPSQLGPSGHDSSDVEGNPMDDAVSSTLRELQTARKPPAMSLISTTIGHI